MLHPYGRYCNANQFAGEMDMLEALAHVRGTIPLIRIGSQYAAFPWVERPAGISPYTMPTAGSRQIRDGLFGNARLLRPFQKEAVKPTWFEKKLFHLYDCTD